MQGISRCNIKWDLFRGGDKCIDNRAGVVDERVVWERTVGVGDVW